MLVAWSLERGWVVRYISLEKLWYMSSRQAKGLASSAQRQLMTYRRQIFVVLEGLCCKPSTIHLGKSPGKYNNEYALSSGRQNPEGTVATGWMQDSMSCLTPGSILATLFQQEGQKPLEVSKKKGDGSQPRWCLALLGQRWQGVSWMEIFCMCCSLDWEVALLS